MTTVSGLLTGNRTVRTRCRRMGLLNAALVVHHPAMYALRVVDLFSEEVEYTRFDGGDPVGTWPVSSREVQV